MPGPTPTMEGPHLPQAKGKPTLQNPPLLRFGKLPSEVIKQVEKLVEYTGSKVPIGQRSSWLKGHLKAAHLNHIGFRDVFEKPDRAKEMQVLKEMESKHPSPNDLEKTYKALLPKLPPWERPQMQALKVLGMYSSTGWMMDKAWDFLENKFNVVNGGCWIGKKTACEDYPYGFRVKDRPMRHVRRKSLDMNTDIPYNWFSMIVRGYGHLLKYCTTEQHGLRWDVSHLCGHSHCVRPSHIIIELHLENLARQQCPGGKRCRCGDIPHAPGFGHRCLGHRNCPNTCPAHLRRLIRVIEKLDMWKEWIDATDKKNADKEDADKEKIPIHPSMRCRVTEKQDYEERLQDALEAINATKDKEATQTARKRKADEEPVERIQKKAKAVTEREVSPGSKAAKEPASKANTATTRAQRRVSTKNK